MLREDRKHIDMKNNSKITILYRHSIHPDPRYQENHVQTFPKLSL
jgi:hypothetical protein